VGIGDQGGRHLVNGAQGLEFALYHLAAEVVERGGLEEVRLALAGGEFGLDLGCLSPEGLGVVAGSEDFGSGDWEGWLWVLRFG